MRGIRRFTPALSLILLLTISATADVRLPHIFGDQMVLQRDQAIPVWGWATPSAEITVTLGEHSATETTNEDGAWRVNLPAMPAGGPHTLSVSGDGSERKFTDVLVGEVWLCSGQSNMEMGVGVVANGAQEIAEADYPDIRLIKFPWRAAAYPEEDAIGQWVRCQPDTIGAGRWGGHSAVAYFFGRRLHKELNVPIGLIESNWGGTRIEPWTPTAALEANPKLVPLVGENARLAQQYRNRLSESLEAIEAWVAKTRVALKDEGRRLPDPPAWPTHPLAHHERPAALYNGMIHHLVPYGIRGVIWYQGESNVLSNDGMMYFEKMKALIGGWRSVWGQDDFPFYYVQIAPFDYGAYYKVSPYKVPHIWEAQAAAMAIPNTGMAVTVDIGDARDIHPTNKQEVARRLALWALARTYGQKSLVHNGPIHSSMEVEDGKVRLKFDHAAGGLVTQDGKPPRGFEIAGEDRRFVAAKARIEGDTLIVWSDTIAAPVAVRYAWHMVPTPAPNVTNQAGLPAAPFRTYQWKDE